MRHPVCPKCSSDCVKRVSRVSFERLMSVFYIYPFRFVTCPRLDRRGKGKGRGVERTREDVLLSVAKRWVGLTAGPLFMARQYSARQRWPGRFILVW